MSWNIKSTFLWCIEEAIYCLNKIKENYNAAGDHDVDLTWPMPRPNGQFGELQ